MNHTGKAAHNGNVVPVMLDLFQDDPDLQMRVDADDKSVEEMAEAMKGGEEFPPGKAVYDETLKKYYRTDGHRRSLAARMAGKKSFPFTLKNGTRRDAILEAVSANMEHDKAGKSRTRADKRRAVETLLSDREWCQWSDAQIAGRAGVSSPFVAAIRKELEKDDHSVAFEVKDSPRQGKDGKARKKRVKHGDDNLVVDENPNDQLPRVNDDENAALELSEPFDGTAPFSEEFAGAVEDAQPTFSDPIDVPNVAVDTDSGVSFNVDDLDPPKNGSIKQDFDDKQIHDLFKKLTRLMDDRLECVGGNAALHRTVQKNLSTAYSSFREWEAA